MSTSLLWPQSQNSEVLSANNGNHKLNGHVINGRAPVEKTPLIHPRNGQFNAQAVFLSLEISGNFHNAIPPERLKEIKQSMCNSLVKIFESGFWDGEQGAFNEELAAMEDDQRKDLKLFYDAVDEANHDSTEAKAKLIFSQNGLATNDWENHFDSFDFLRDRFDALDEQAQKAIIAKLAAVRANGYRQGELNRGNTKENIYGNN